MVSPKRPAKRRTPGKMSQVELRGQVAAINRSQSVVVYSVDGVVLDANQNFLLLMGYSLDEIRGQHHRLFVETTEQGSDGYRSFWEKLSRGEDHSGQYRRIGKGGRRVWMLASYNPIFGTKGKVLKVVQYASDVTARRLRAADFEGQLSAVSKAQQVIELQLDGTIMNANDNFLSATGYTREEVIGKNHSFFVDPLFRESGEYRSFWQKLARGEYHAGQYKRVAKDGRELWIQASYNPIKDLDGKPLKVVKYATDITEARRQNEMNAAFKGALDNLTSNVMVADTDLNIIYMNNTMRRMMSDVQPDIRKELPDFDASRLMGTNINSFHKNLAYQREMLATLDKTFVTQLILGGRTFDIMINPMLDANGKRMGTVIEWADRTIELAVEREVQSIVTAVADGDFATRMPIEGKAGFFQVLGNGLNRMTDNMTEIVSWVQAAATEVSRGVAEISQGNLDLRQRTEEQASSLEETASSMEEMTSTVKQNADNSSKASELASAARNQADQGGAVVTKAIRAMTEINESSRKIVDIIGVIDEIAFQTNLLALNAAVEAARAGEQGRGFAVVATEVRNLASRSATAAKEIKGLIQDSVEKVEEGSLLVTQSGQTLEHIMTAVKKVSDIIGEIASANHQQSAGIEQVNHAVMRLDDMTQQNAALVEQASASSQSVANQAIALNAMVGRYKVSKEAAAAAVTAINITAAAQKTPRPVAGPINRISKSERHVAKRTWSGGVANAAVNAVDLAANGADSEWKEF